MLTQERLKEILDYDPETGVFTWLVNPPRGRPRKGNIAGTKDPFGYIKIRIRGKDYFGGPLAWFWVIGKWPKDEIDHIDLDKANNRFVNLREATRQENCRNRPLFKNNKLGLKGVSTAHSGGYRARVRVNGKEIHLGVFANPGDAHAAYQRFVEGAYEKFGRLT